MARWLTCFPVSAEPKRIFSLPCPKPSAWRTHSAIFVGSIGRRKPASKHLRSEVAIVAGLAKATLPPNPKLRWDEWVGDYALIREQIEETYSEMFHGYRRAHVAARRLLQGQ